MQSKIFSMPKLVKHDQYWEKEQQIKQHRIENILELSNKNWN